METFDSSNQDMPQLAKQIMAIGFRDGEVKGFRDGEVKGEVKARRKDLLRAVVKRGIVLTDEQKGRIQECSDDALLDRWFDNVFDAKTADELFR